jgi:hypothetical protein
LKNRLNFSFSHNKCPIITSRNAQGKSTRLLSLGFPFGSQSSTNVKEDAENALTAYAREQTRRESLPQSVQANEQALELSTQLYKFQRLI